MDYLSGGVSNLTSIPTRNHANLQLLTADDHPQYDIVRGSLQGTATQVGLDASKPGTCTVGDSYSATDTLKFYVCFTTNAWTQIYNVMTSSGAAAGDSLYFDGTKWQRLHIGTAGQLLNVNAGATAPAWRSSLITSYAYANYSTDVEAGVGYSQIVFDTDVVDGLGEYAVGNGHFTATVAGTYLVSLCGFVIPNNSTSSIGWALYKNGTKYMDGAGATVGVSTADVSIVFTGLITLAAADYLTFYTNHSGSLQFVLRAKSSVTVVKLT